MTFDFMQECGTTNVIFLRQLHEKHFTKKNLHFALKNLEIAFDRLLNDVDMVGFEETRCRRVAG